MAGPVGQLKLFASGVARGSTTANFLPVLEHKNSRTCSDDPAHNEELIPLANGMTVEIANRAEIDGLDLWRTAFDRFHKDSRYYELVEDTICPDFDFRYLVLREPDGIVRAIQPCFVLRQDILAGCGGGLIRLANLVRRFWPRFLHLRTLMVGCAAGEGHIGADIYGLNGSPAWLAEALVPAARRLGARLVVLKEFPVAYRNAMAPLAENGFARLPSLPMTRLDLDPDGFDAFLQRSLGRVTRKNLRRKLKAAAQSSPIEMSVLTDASAIMDEIYPLYLQVYERSERHFEKLTREFFREVGRRIPDKVRFFVWRRDGKAVAFSLCMLDGDAIHDEYLGLDYAVAFDLHLYHYTFRDVFDWASRNGYSRYFSTSLNYDPKLHLRCLLYPLDLYVRHTSGLANRIMGLALHWLDPTRAESLLLRFPNFQELHGR